MVSLFLGMDVSFCPTLSCCLYLFFRDSIVINLVSFATSLYAGIAVFSIIGFMAKEYDLPINEVIKTGKHLNNSGEHLTCEG